MQTTFLQTLWLLLGLLISVDSFADAAPITDRLLQRAEQAFAQGQRLQPDTANAYLYYQAVLTLEPDNQQAQAGLQAILVEEAQNTRNLLANSHIQSAQRRYALLNQLFESSALLKDLKSHIQRARVEQNAQFSTKTLPENDKQWLNEQDLVLKNDAIKSVLSLAAQRVSQTEEGVFIYARSDADGRWIYQQMRQVVPNYRIRGDIRLGKPALRFLAPF